MCLPHPATLRRILATHNCNVGFMSEVMNFLKEKASSGNTLANVCLVFDSMHIKSEKSTKLQKVDIGVELIMVMY